MSLVWRGSSRGLGPTREGVRPRGGRDLKLFYICSILRVAGVATMNAEKEREIIKLWNCLRLLQREGRPTTAVRKQIEKALAEREEAA
jgi:hypothetical protein